MRSDKKMNVYLAITLMFISVCVSFLVVNPFLFNYVYAAAESPTCNSRILEKLNVNRTYSSIDEYVEVNVRPGITNGELHGILENISPIAVDRFNDSEEIILLICEEPLNNLVYSAHFDNENKLIRIEYEDFP